MGQVLQAGVGQHPARQAALAAGMPVSVAACSVNKMCGSGLLAAGLAARAIKAGEVRLVAAGGMENMSQAHILTVTAATGRTRNLEGLTIHDGLGYFRQLPHGPDRRASCEKYCISRRNRMNTRCRQSRCCGAGVWLRKSFLLPCLAQGRSFERAKGRVQSLTPRWKSTKPKPAFQKEASHARQCLRHKRRSSNDPCFSTGC